MDPPTDFHDPSDRPSKRVRIEEPAVETATAAAIATPEEPTDDGDWDDIYGESSDAKDSKDANTMGVTVEPKMSESSHVQPILPPNEPAFAATEQHAESGAQENTIQSENAAETDHTNSAMGDLPDAVVDQGDELVDQHHGVAPEDRAALTVLEETSAVNGDTNAKIETFDDNEESDYEPGLDTVALPATDQDMPDVTSAGGIVSDAQIGGDEEAEKQEAGPPKEPKVTEDAEFMAAAAAQKGAKNAEWQFDSSDAESSDSDSDSSDSDSDSGSDDEYKLLDPATMAKMLMSGDGEDDEGGKKDKIDADHQPRTVNEVKEAVIPKPDVVITEDMAVTELGNVSNIVGSMLVIKGATPGEYQVLESGSVLCNEKREVIGVVSETIGRVQEPMYIMQFNNRAEIDEAGLTDGTKVFYVDKHSTFVFTQPLKKMKGTDASNIHDEEVAEDEAEFSDDEAEAEYKKQKKAAKKAARGGGAAGQSSRGGRPGSSGQDNAQTFTKNRGDAPQQSYGGGMSYDEADGTEDMYTPIRRPDNLSELMAGGIPPRPNFDRGRGRGRGDRGRGDRGRGRGDRGRGRGGFDNSRGQRGGPNQQHDRNQRGGRGGHGGHRGPAQSFPDYHNTERAQHRSPHSLPTKPDAVPDHANAAPSPPVPHPQAYPSPAAGYPNQAAPAPAQQTYQFNGFTFQHPNQAPAPAPTPAAMAAAQSYLAQYQQSQGHAAPVPMPPGAYVNPAYFANQQAAAPQAQWSQQQQPQQQQYHQQQAYQQPSHGYAAWSAQPGVPQGQTPANGTAQNQAQQPQAQTPGNLADILRVLQQP